MIELLFAVIVFAIIGGVLYWVVSLLPLPEPFPTIIRVCVILICVLVLLGVLFGGVQIPALNVRR